MTRKSLVTSLCGILALATWCWGDNPGDLDNQGENSVAFCPDGKSVVTGGADGVVRIRDAATGAIRTTLVGHKARVYSVAVSPDGRTVASVASDCTTRLWDIECGSVRRVLQMPTPPIGPLKGGVRTIGRYRGAFQTVAFSPDGRTVATGDADGDLQRSLARSFPDRYDHAVTADDVGHIRLWDAETGELKESWAADPGRVVQLLYSPDGATIASVGGDLAVKLWDARTHQLRRSLPIPEKSTIHMAYSPDGATLAVSHSTGVTLYDPASGKVKDRLDDPCILGTQVAFTPDGDYLVVAGLAISRLYAIKPTADPDDRWSDLPFRNPGINCCSAVAVSPDGHWVAYGFRKLSNEKLYPTFQLIAIR